MNQNQRDIPADAQIDDDELEMIRKFRMLDERGKRFVRNALQIQFDYVMSHFDDKIAAGALNWLPNAAFAVGNVRIEFEGGSNR